MKRGLIFIVLVLFLVGFVSAATYYVSPTGSASWSSCTNINTPCSLSTANSNAVAGDVVILKTGDYGEQQIIPTHSGTSGHVITFQRNADAICTFSNQYQPSVYLDSKSYIVIDGLYFGVDGSLNYAAGAHRHVYIYNGSNYNEIKNCNFTGTAPQNGYPDLTIWTSNYNYVHNNVFDPGGEANGNTNPPNYESDTLQVYGGLYNRIINNSFNEGHGHFMITIGWGSTYNVVRSNTLSVTDYWNDAANPADASSNGYIEILVNSYHNLVEKNTLTKTMDSVAESVPLQVDPNCAYNIFRKQTITGAAGSTAIYHDSSYNSIYNCIYYHGVYNGRYYQYGLITIGSEGSEDVGNTAYNEIVNNVFDTYNISDGVEIDGISHTHDNRYRGNILYGTPSNEIRRFGTPKTLFEAESSWGSEFLDNVLPTSTQPTYRDAANGDFTPQPNSPAIDAGAWLTIITSSTGSGKTSFTVANPYFFYDGWGIPGETGDVIKTEHGQTTTIQSINYNTNTITVSPAISIVNGEGLALDYSGTKPDIGAIEYTTAQTLYCGDGICNNGETCSTCPGDCGVCPTANTYTILKTSTPPTIDGNLNEFANTNPITITNSNGNSLIYKMLWDSNNLYIAAQGSDSQLAALNTTRDGALWNDDAIELFFDTLNDGGTSMNSNDYKFFVNLLNTQRDSYFGGGGASWNTVFTSAVTKTGTLNVAGDTDTGYTIEAAIPWANWGVLVPADNSVWGFDVSMNDRNDAGNVIQKAWSQTNVGNIPDEFGDIIFSSQTVGGSSTCGNADSNSNGIVSITELIDYIGRWKAGEVNITQLIDAIGKWKSGC